MLNAKKMAAVAGVLCSFALIGAGHAFAVESGAACGESGMNNGRCVQKAEYSYTTDDHGNVHVINHQTQECESGECVSRVTVGGKVIEESQKS